MERSWLVACLQKELPPLTSGVVFVELNMPVSAVSRACGQGEPGEEVVRHRSRSRLLAQLDAGPTPSCEAEESWNEAAHLRESLGVQVRILVDLAQLNQMRFLSCIDGVLRGSEFPCIDAY